MNIYSPTGNLYLTINTKLTSRSGLLTFSYEQLKRMFNKFIITDQNYKIFNDNELIYTTLFDTTKFSEHCSSEIMIIITHLTIKFYQYDLILIKRIKQNPFILREINDSQIKDDEDIIKYCVMHDGILLKFASNRQRDNPEVVKQAVNQNVLSLKYASSRLKNDREFILPSDCSFPRMEVDIKSISCSSHFCLTASLTYPPSVIMVSIFVSSLSFGILTDRTFASSKLFFTVSTDVMTCIGFDTSQVSTP